MVTAIMRHAKQPRRSRADRDGLLLPLLGVALLIFIDQLAKLLVRESLVQSQSIKLLGFLEIVNFTNTGSAFGMLKGAQPYLIAFGLVAAAALSFSYSRLESRLQKLCAVMIVAGILGNTIDRVSAGVVTDFIYLKPWPAFNIADSLLFIGTAALLYSLILPSSRKRTGGKVRT